MYFWEKFRCKLPNILSKLLQVMATVVAKASSKVVTATDPSSSVRIASPSVQKSESYSVIGDPGAVGQYKVRRFAHDTPNANRGQRRCCKYNARQSAKCWAYVNLVVSVLDLLFSLCELVVWTTPLSKHVESTIQLHDNILHWVFLLTSVVMHGDCVETLVEIAINLLGELVYVLASFLFAFATVLDKEDYTVARCLVQWYRFSVWIPLLALMPRFVLNVVSSCGSHFLNLFPNSNENAPRIAFWLINIVNLFFMIIWLLNGRVVALNFSAFMQKEQAYLQSSKQRNKFGSVSSTDTDTVSFVPSLTSHLGGAGDKTLKGNGFRAMLPPSHEMV